MFDTTTPHRLRRTRPAPGPHQAHTRPAPGFFSDVTQFDLAGGAGQKRDLRTMEPVSDIIGHCFVVGDTRHQLRASMSAGWRGSAGQVRRNCRIRRQFQFFPGKNPDTGAGLAGGFYAGQVARPGFCARQARQWSAMKNENFNMSIRHVVPGTTRWARLLCRAGSPKLLD